MSFVAIDPRVRKRILTAFDTDNGDAVTGVAADQTQVICNNGDNICDGGALVLPPHLQYAADAEDAAAFVVGL